MVKNTALTNQSIIIAIQTPITPILNAQPSKIPKPIRNVHIDATLTIIVNLASFAALNVFGRVKAIGQIITAKIACMVNILSARIPVSVDKP